MTDFYARDLFPSITPYESGMLEVDDIHTIYWEQCGNPDGVPVLFLHGGPGAGAAAIHRRFFDPAHYRIVLLDQRGCGRSLPSGEITNNTTDHLIDDLEVLRGHLGIEKWFVFGGSWGSTLSLAYGVAHPDRCLGFILRGVFLGQQYESEWFINGMGNFFPEAGQSLRDHLPEGEYKSYRDIIDAYCAMMSHPDVRISHRAAKVWADFEEACATLHPHPQSEGECSLTSFCLARLESHYFQHDFFMEEGHLLNNLHKINHLPCFIVQGRYDVICPPITAQAVARGWPRAQLIMVSDAGHSALEPGIRKSLVHATEAFKKLV